MRKKLNDWWKGMMLTCEDVSRMSFDIPDDIKLSFSDRLKLKVHRNICMFCRRYYKQTKFLKRAIKVHSQKSAEGDTSNMKMPDEAKERLKKLLHENTKDSRA